MKHIQTIITCYLEARTCELCSTSTRVLWATNSQFSLDNTLHTNITPVYYKQVTSINKRINIKK